MKTIIGIAGVKGSGKDTVAGMIKEIIPNAVQHALADKLKDVCSDIFNVPRDLFDNQDLKEVPLQTNRKLSIVCIDRILSCFDIEATLNEIVAKLGNIIGTTLTTPREIAQIVGTEVLRKFGGENIHCIHLPLDSEITIVSDLRFPNEFDYFSNLSASSVKATPVVLADDVVDFDLSPNFRFIPLYVNRISAEEKIKSDSHSSETSVFIFCNKCEFIDNNGSLDDLRLRIHNVTKNFINSNL